MQSALLWWGIMYSVFQRNFSNRYLLTSLGEALGRTAGPGRTVTVPANRSFVSARDTELCVVCRRDTGVWIGTDISERDGYEPGVGQCCDICARI